MTKKTRFSILVTAIFFGAIILFTSAFLIFLQHNPNSAAELAATPASPSSTIDALSWGDATTLILVSAGLLLFVYYVAKS